jgi:hypothetical protein
MKISFIPFLACLFLITTGLVSCSKNSSSSTAVSNMTLITQSAWVYDTAGIGEDSSGVISSALPVALPECQKEDTFYFYTNGTGSENAGPMKCDSAGPESTPFNWSFNASQNVISTTDTLFSGFSGNISITSLTETQLHLLTVVLVDNIPFTVDIYLKH